ncbi:MAG TPA: alpha/beta hydrolase, partial [Pseudonocardia sp.]|nr:alpha/beta hydrolase [Pseudonocardia sp.]
MSALEVDTPHGLARVALHCAPEGRAGLLLGHGAGGGVSAPDLVAAAQSARR